MEEGMYYVVGENALREIMKDLLDNLVDDRIYNRFEGVLIDAKTACTILSISPDSLYKYTVAKLIQCEERNGRSDYRYRLSEILRADVKEIRKRMRYKML